MYRFILLESSDYLRTISFKANVATEGGNDVTTCARFGLKQIWRLTKAMAEMKWNTEQRDEIAVAVPSSLWVRVELMAW